MRNYMNHPHTMDAVQTKSNKSTKRVANWRKKQGRQGLRTYKFVFPQAVYKTIKDEQLEYNLKSISEFVQTLLIASKPSVKVSDLVMPPVTPKNDTTVQAHVYLEQNDITFIDNIKSSLGLPRSKVVEALMLTMPDAIERVASQLKQPNFNFDKEASVKPK